MRKRRSKRKQTNKAAVLFLYLVIICIVIFTAGMAKWTYDFVQESMPSSEYVEKRFDGIEQPVIYKGEIQPLSAIGSEASLKLALSTVREVIDPHIYYEEGSGSVVVTTEHKHVHFRTDQLTAMMNERPLELQFPVVKEDDIVYIPIEPLVELYGIDVRESAETGAVTIWKENDLLQWGNIVTYAENDEPIALRVEPSVKAAIVADLQADEPVVILEERDGWYYVQRENGTLGYVLKSRVVLTTVEQIPVINKEQPFIPWKPLGGKINLTWEAVYNVPPKPENIGEMPGVNVISPTWFELRKNEDGSFFVYNNHADANYVRWAHDRGYQVWALFSNSFDPDLTTEMLSTYESRMEIIKQLLSFAELYQLQGINLDFENVYLADKDLLTQFVRELTPLMHEQGLVVSMDVTIRGGSEMWSLFYDREELGKIIDYMIVMTYDEHYAASPVAGSVASLPWVEKGMTNIMEFDGVPNSKLILGAPTYTRIWTERNEAGNVRVSSRAVSMNAVNEIIASRNLVPTFLEDVGQHYVDYTNSEGHLERIWIEDATSMRLRAELVNKYDFAGIATWRRGFETPDIWDVINETLNERP